MSILHTFVNPKADGPDTTIVRPSDWNAAHAITGTLAWDGATVTASTPLLDLTQTWNNAGVAFTALKLNVTNTASAAGSKLLDLQIGGTSLFSVDKFGTTGLPDGVTLKWGGGGSWIYGDGSSASANQWVKLGANLNDIISVMYERVTLRSAASLGWCSTTEPTAAQDLSLFRDAAAILAQRNSTNAQAFRVYNTYTDASNYERGVFDWTTTANTLKIGTEKAGTGSTRNLQFIAGGANILDYGISNSNAFSFNAGGGVSYFAISASGGFYGINGSGIFKIHSTPDSTGSAGPGTFKFSSDGVYQWASGGALTGADTGISRSAAGVLAIGNGTQGDSSATIVAKTKAGAVVAGDLASGSWAVIRDTSGATTKLYYNNAGTLMSVALT